MPGPTGCTWQPRSENDKVPRGAAFPQMLLTGSRSTPTRMTSSVGEPNRIPEGKPEMQNCPSMSSSLRWNIGMLDLLVNAHLAFDCGQHPEAAREHRLPLETDRDLELPPRLLHGLLLRLLPRPGKLQRQRHFVLLDLLLAFLPTCCATSHFTPQLGDMRGTTSSSWPSAYWHLSCTRQRTGTCQPSTRTWQRPS